MGSIPAILVKLAKLRPQYRKKTKPYSRLGLAVKKFTSVRALLADRKRQTAISFTRKRFSYRKFLSTRLPRVLVRKSRLTKLTSQGTYRRVSSTFNGKVFFRFKTASLQPELPYVSVKSRNGMFLWFPKDATSKRVAPLQFCSLHNPSQFFNENTAVQVSPIANMVTSLGSITPANSLFSKNSAFSYLHLLTLRHPTALSSAPHHAFIESIADESYSTWTMFLGLSQNLRFKQDVLRKNVIRLGRTREILQFFNYHSLTDLQLDKRVKILIPDLKDTPRGSFWVPLKSGIGQPQVSKPRASGVGRRSVVTKTYQTLAKTSLRKAPSRKLKQRSRGLWRTFTRHLKFRSGRSRWLLARWKRRGRRIKRKILRRKKGAFKQLRRFPFFLIARRRRNQRSNKFSQTALNSPKRRSISRHPVAFYSEHERVKAQLTAISKNPLHSSAGKLRFLKLAKVSPVFQPSAVKTDSVSHKKLAMGKAEEARSTPTKAWALHLDLLSTVWLNPLFLKYFIFKVSAGSLQPNSLQNVAIKLQNRLQSYVFGSSIGAASRSNLWVAPSSNYVIRKKLLRSTSYSLFSVDLSLWYYKSLTSFIEDCSGRKVALRIGPFLEGALTFEDRAYCSLWGIRVTGFQRMLGHKIFAHEALMLVALSFRLKDPTFLANWIRGMLKRLSFWKYRLIFRYLKFLFQHIFRPNFRVFGFRGLKLRLKGKISVAGNARTRTLFYKVGDTSHSKMDNKVAYDLSYVNTFTGIMGFKLWFFY